MKHIIWPILDFLKDHVFNGDKVAAAVYFTAFISFILGIVVGILVGGS